MALLLLYFSLRAQATTADGVFWQKLNRARTPTEIRGLQIQFEDLRVARRACAIQMRSHAIPSACFEALARESKWGLAANAKTMLAKLNSICDEAALALREPLEIIDARGLSPECRKSVLKARQIDRYRRDELVQDLN